jgi:colanic acid/amylovoran biosynthesis glycosyltransferase
MKIAFLIEDAPDKMGGVTSWEKRILPEFKMHNIDVVVLCMTYIEADNCPTADFLSRKGIRCIIGKWPRFINDRIHWLLNNLREIQPDVFVCNWLVAGFFTSAVLRAAGIPVIGVMHSVDEMYQGITDEFIFGNRAFRAAGMVFVSEMQRNILLDNRPIDIPTQVIPCGVPVPEKREKPQSCFRIVYIGRLTEDAKQISLLAHAFCNVVEQVEGVEAHIYGDGECREAVVNILASRGTNLPVYYNGAVDVEDVLKVLQSLHVIVLLSDYEGMPVSLMEGMACGLVPVCLKAPGGIMSTVRNNENGLLVNNRDDEFVAAIKLLKNNKQLYNKLSANARKDIENQFSIEFTTPKWISFIEEVQRNFPQQKKPISTKVIKLPPPNPKIANWVRRKPAQPLITQIKMRLKNILSSHG